MDLRLIARPVSHLLAGAHPPFLPFLATRGHKTTSRTKRALKIPPHDSFLPSRTAFPAGDTIIYNPPASEASPAHTPFLFLPRGDPRRANLRHTEAQLPPQMKYKHRTARYHLQEKDLQEMKRLREEDPVTWSVGKLAAKFDCSEVFVKMVAPATREHKNWLQDSLDVKMARWGPRKAQARDDRKRRAEMMYRGEL